MKKNYNPELVAGAAIRDDKGRRISKLFEASHPKMTVGYAKNLIMPDDPTEQEFNFRQAGGGVIEDGVAVIDKVKGKSVVWNQLVTQSVIVVSPGTYPDTRISDNLVAGHKYLFRWEQKNTITSVVRNTPHIGTQHMNTSENYHLSSGWYTWIVDANNNSYASYWIHSPNENLTVANITIHDLTQMFGAGNEPSTYEEFLARKPIVEDEYAYNEGEIVSNNVEAVKSTGVNLWDEEWENGTYGIDGSKITSDDYWRGKNPIKVSAGETLYIKNNYANQVLLACYDGNGNFVKRVTLGTRIFSATYVVESGVQYIIPSAGGTTVYKAPNHDICINISDPSINGQYFPYEEHTLALDWVKEIKDTEGNILFPDGLKSAGNVYDEVRGGKAVKRIGVVDLGELTWEKSKCSGSDNYHFRTTGLVNYNYPSSNTEMGNWLCIKYPALMGYRAYYGEQGVGIWNIPKYICVCLTEFNGYTEAQFKAAMRGVTFLYELATPIEVEYDEKNLTYPVVSGGTEEAISAEDSSAFRADIGYGIDAVKTILKLKERVTALENK